MRAIALGALWFLAFVALGQWAPGFMHETIYKSVQVGHVLALSQFVMIGLVGWTRLRDADPEWDGGPTASARR
jgi:uncharacterized membrane protein (DUF485 family)